MTQPPSQAPAPSAGDEREAFEQWRADRAEQKRTGGKFVLTVEGRAMARDIFANDADGWLLPLLDEVERLEAFVAALTSQPPAPALVDERAEFEATMRKQGCPDHWTFEGDGTGGYHNMVTEWAWNGWQARAALTPPGVRPDPAGDADADLNRQRLFSQRLMQQRDALADEPDAAGDAGGSVEPSSGPLPLSPSGAESLGVKEQSQEVHPVASSSGSLPLGITAELLEDALQVLRMVDDNHRVDAGERRKAWGGRFVVDEVRRVLTKGGA